jgi:hypothetical protein
MLEKTSVPYHFPNDIYSDIKVKSSMLYIKGVKNMVLKIETIILNLYTEVYTLASERIYSV